MDKTQIPTNYIKHTSKNPLQRFLIERFFSSLVSLAKPLKAKKVLDAGCGEGFSLNKLIINNVGEELEGIENSKEAIILGKKLFPKAKVKLGSVYDLPYKTNYFDLVLCTEVLEHLENPQKALLEIIRVSKKHVILSVPNEPFFRLANFLSWERRWQSSIPDNFLPRSRPVINSLGGVFWILVSAAAPSLAL